jgi:hypothetical protein
MYISTWIHVFSKVGVTVLMRPTSLKRPFFFCFFSSLPPTSFINICEKDCLVGSIMMMEGLAYLVEAGCFCFFGSQFQYYVGVCVEKKEKRRSKNRQH